jgi:hypothetical protein
VADIRAYAIVSADDRIADRDGRLPPALMNEADWAYFQAELDACDAIVIGRASHEAAPNARGRRRIIMSSTSKGLEERADGCWWNPSLLAWREAARRLSLEEARIGAPGGQTVFDYFLKNGLRAFHLSRAHRASLPGGRGVFAEVERGESAEAILRREGFRADAPRVIDAAAEVTLTVWRRAET